MQSADRFGPLKGLCPYKALIGFTQATGLAGGFDCGECGKLRLIGGKYHSGQTIELVLDKVSSWYYDKHTPPPGGVLADGYRPA